MHCYRYSAPKTPPISSFIFIIDMDTRTSTTVQRLAWMIRKREYYEGKLWSISLSLFMRWGPILHITGRDRLPSQSSHLLMFGYGRLFIWTPCSFRIFIPPSHLLQISSFLIRGSPCPSPRLMILHSTHEFKELACDDIPPSSVLYLLWVYAYLKKYSPENQ